MNKITLILLLNTVATTSIYSMDFSCETLYQKHLTGTTITNFPSCISKTKKLLNEANKAKKEIFLLVNPIGVENDNNGLSEQTLISFGKVAYLEQTLMTDLEKLLREKEQNDAEETAFYKKLILEKKNEMFQVEVDQKKAKLLEMQGVITEAENIFNENELFAKENQMKTQNIEWIEEFRELLQN